MPASLTLYSADFFSAGPVPVGTLLGMYMWAGRTGTNSIQTEQISYMGLLNILERGRGDALQENSRYCRFNGHFTKLLFYKYLKILLPYWKLANTALYKHLKLCGFWGNFATLLF